MSRVFPCIKSHHTHKDVRIYTPNDKVTVGPKKMESDFLPKRVFDALAERVAVFKARYRYCISS